MLASRLNQRFPLIHLIAASICAFILGITLLLLPSEPVSATKESASQTTPLRSFPQGDSNIADTAERIRKDLINTPAVTPSVPTAKKPPAEATDKATNENWVYYSVQRNDNLTSLFKRAGLSDQDVYYVSKAIGLGKELTNLYPGELLAFQIEAGTLKKVRYDINPLKTLLISATPDGYVAKMIERTPETRERFAQGQISDSLFADAEKAGISNSTIMNFATIFGWDIDFSQDLREGDTFKIIYNEQYLDGEKIADGTIMAAQLISQGNTYTAIRYTNTDGTSSYYTPDGHSMRKAFLRMPVDFARISSRFNLARKHPVLNKIRAHKGVDYAAKTGTPIRASGDGKVQFIGRKGGYGNTVVLQHGSNITTLYAHMSRFNSKLKNGSRVSQGQVIGYIGSSGLATGPHLHYEFRVDGTHKNPMTVKFPQAEPVAKAEKSRFTQIASQMMAQLDDYSTQRVARAN